MSETMDTRRETLLQNYRQVETRVLNAERQFQRTPGSVRIMAVSKTWPAEDIACLAEAGVTVFGESYLQEAQEKIAALEQYPLEWHFIGPIQSNKTRAIAELFHWVHSVDREKVARRLNEQRPKTLGPLNVCIQVNSSGETSKSGVSIEGLPALLDVISGFPGLRIRGLMTIPEPSPDFDTQRSRFGMLHRALEALNRSGWELDTLSMGMSADLEAAIAEGSTIIRVGTDIFGARS